MTRKVYRTAQGKLVDLGRLQLQNENTRAVGNMNVNARGDRLDSQNRAIDKRPAQVQRQYERQTTPVEAPPARPTSKPKPNPIAVESPKPPEDFEDDFDASQIPQATTGLAAAIARARQIKQDPLRTPQETARHQEGVKKL